MFICLNIFSWYLPMATVPSPVVTHLSYLLITAAQTSRKTFLVSELQKFGIVCPRVLLILVLLQDLEIP